MKISLIMGTVNRLDEVARFLTHLERQSYRNFELIIVDSNKDNRLNALIDEYKGKFQLIHVKYYMPGVSRARNQGINYATGDLIGFPDDDCWYPPDLLSSISNWFALNPDKPALITRAITEQGKTLGRYKCKKEKLNRYDIWRCPATFTMFYRKNILPDQPVFKESLGVGAGTPWGAAEDVQLMIDVLNSKCTLIYNPDLAVFHPNPFDYVGEILIKRGLPYGAGMGYVMSTNNYPLWFFIYYLLRCIAGTIIAFISFDRSKVKHNLQTFHGRLYGWRSRHT